MHTAIVTTWGEVPKYVEVPTPPVPDASSDHIQLEVVATALHQLVKSRASGKHYSAKSLPHVPGVDGVGRTASGELVYFSTLSPALSGSFSEVVNVLKADTAPLPEGLDPIQAAGLMNPAMSSWMAIKKRTQALRPGWTCLILGATTTSGGLAISIARRLGAGKVIGVARNMNTLSTLGLDSSIQLMDPVLDTNFRETGDVDVILDYLYGAPAVVLLTQLVSKVPTQYVQIGSLAGTEALLPSAIFRSKDITMRGSGPGAWPSNELRGEWAGMLNALLQTGKKQLNVRKLSEVENVWNEKGDRLVFTP